MICRQLRLIAFSGKGSHPILGHLEEVLIAVVPGVAGLIMGRGRQVTVLISLRHRCIAFNDRQYRAL